MSYIFTSQLEAIENIRKQLDEAIAFTERELRTVHVQRNELLIFTKFRNANSDMYEPVNAENYDLELSTFAERVKQLTEQLERHELSKIRFEEFVHEQYKGCSEVG